jgi:hypothetical protein
MWKGQTFAPRELQIDFLVKTVISGFISRIFGAVFPHLKQNVVQIPLVLEIHHYKVMDFI